MNDIVDEGLLYTHERGSEYEARFEHKFRTYSTRLSRDQGTDYRYECESNKVRVGTGQYLKWMEGFTTLKIRIEINLIPVTVSQ